MKMLKTLYLKPLAVEVISTLNCLSWRDFTADKCVFVGAEVNMFYASDKRGNEGLTSQPAHAWPHRTSRLSILSHLFLSTLISEKKRSFSWISLHHKDLYYTGTPQPPPPSQTHMHAKMRRACGNTVPFKSRIEADSQRTVECGWKYNSSANAS